MGVLRPFYINRRATERKGFVLGFLVFSFKLDDSSGQTLWEFPECGEARIKQWFNRAYESINDG